MAVRGQVKVIQGQRSFWGHTLKFKREFNQGHQKSFQGHHYISKTPPPTLTKLAWGIALHLPGILGWLGTNGHLTSFQGHHFISKTPLLILIKHA